MESDPIAHATAMGRFPVDLMLESLSVNKKRPQVQCLIRIIKEDSTKIIKSSSWVAAWNLGLALAVSFSKQHVLVLEFGMYQVSKRITRKRAGVENIEFDSRKLATLKSAIALVSVKTTMAPRRAPPIVVIYIAVAACLTHFGFVVEKS